MKEAFKPYFQTYKMNSWFYWRLWFSPADYVESDGYRTSRMCNLSMTRFKKTNYQNAHIKEYKD